MEKPTIVLACGARKRGAPSPALDLYTGPLFADARDWALSVAPRERIFILSARHGFVPASTVLEPYDRRLDDPRQLAELLRGQLCRGAGGPSSPDLIRLAYSAGPRVLVGGADYRRALQLAAFDVVALADCLPPGRAQRGLGAQRSWLRGHHGQLPLATPAQ